jgi:hypothetical protein
MSQPILFPFHPVNGLRLCATLDFVQGIVHREIVKEDGMVVLEDGTETEMDWNAAQEQANCTVRFLATEDGNECLEYEAVWREDDVESIQITEPGKATKALSANVLRDRIAELGSAAREVVLNYDEGKNVGDALAALKDLLEAMDLMDPVEEDPSDE